MIVGLDIGGHHVAGARVVPGSWTIEPGSYRHRETDRNSDAATLLDSWAGLIAELLEVGDARQVGIAIPGPFDYRSGTAWFEGNQKFEALYGVDVRSELGRRLGGGSAVRFLNDATAFAVGATAAESPQPDRVLALTLGTGLGSAFLEQGIPVVDSAAAPVPDDGCLWHLPFGQSIADDYVSTRWIVGEARRRLGLDCSVASLAELADNEPEAGAIFADYGRNLGLVLAPWVRDFAPGKLVAGGRITRAFRLFSRSLADAIAGSGKPVPILIHENTEDAAIIGGAKTFDDAFWAAAEPGLPSR